MTNTDLIERLQKDAGLPHPPTQLTYALRMAVSGKGDRAYDWEDKPHRLLYDACREAEVLAAALAEANAKLVKAQEIERLAYDACIVVAGSTFEAHDVFCQLRRATLAELEDKP